MVACFWSGGGRMLVGAGVYAVSTVYDIATAAQAARRYNDRHGLDFSAGPVVTPRGAGARLAWRF